MSASTKRVLLVDDDDEVIESTRLALEGRGYEVLVARNGRDALVRAERDSPDLIVLDLVMPHRSGFSVLERLHRNRLGSPAVIVVSGNTEQRFQDVAEAVGADAFLRKPFNVEQLLETVDSLI